MKLLSKQVAAQASSLDLSRAVAGYAARVGAERDLRLLLVLSDALRLVAGDNMPVDLPFSAITNVTISTSANVTTFAVSSVDDEHTVIKLYSEADSKDLAAAPARGWRGFDRARATSPRATNNPTGANGYHPAVPWTSDHESAWCGVGIVRRQRVHGGDEGQPGTEQRFDRLGESADAMGANAIVGLSGSPFGAGGGITSAFGGDAVGILLLGTAVEIEITREP